MIFQKHHLLMLSPRIWLLWTTGQHLEKCAVDHCVLFKTHLLDGT